jgi:hypothetical protein
MAVAREPPSLKTDRAVGGWSHFSGPLPLPRQNEAECHCPHAECGTRDSPVDPNAPPPCIPRALKQKNAVKTSLCEVIEIRNSADAVGSLCSRTASTQCSDCGTELCESHTETCGACRSIFCPPCLSFHQTEHPKPFSADHGQDRERKRA